MTIADMADAEFRRLLGGMEQDPAGYGRIDLEGVLLRTKYSRHSNVGFDLYLREGHRPFHLLTTQDEVPDFLARMIAKEALAILNEVSK